MSILLKGLAVSALTALVAGPVLAGETITYSYDSQGRLVEAAYSGTINNGQKHAICYDTADNRTRYKSSAAGSGLTCPNGNPQPPPPIPTITIGDIYGNEGQNLGFAVTLSNSYTSSISVNYATANGTAGATDYTATSGTLTINAGQTQGTILVYAKTDTKIESDETFFVNLSNPTGGATIVDSQGMGTIYDMN